MSLLTCSVAPPLAGARERACGSLIHRLMPLESQANHTAPHPLAERLAAHLHPGDAVLDAGTGGGRNARALGLAGMLVAAVSDADAYALLLPRGPFDGAIATHALLHGAPAAIAELVAEIAGTLRAKAFFCATFASANDARFGMGERLGERTFAPTSGDEVGVAHSYFDEPALRALLAPNFDVESLEEMRVDAVAGRWAHPREPLSGAMHWFVEARRNEA